MIPNIFHFIYFYPDNDIDYKFPLSHYLCVKSAYVLNKPERINFYLNREPSGEYWDKIKKIINIIYVNPPEEVFGNKLFHAAHKSDVLRIQILKENGGIYMDLDIICKKPFFPLYKYNFVMGKQGKWRKMGLCNGVILAEKNAEFLSIWYNEYKTFRSKGHDKYWAEHSVLRPLLLSKKFPDLIHIEPYDSFHFPLYYSFSLKKIFEKCIDFPNAYCHHLWEAASKDKYLKNLNENEIFNKDTTYNIIARKFLN
jgi:mannosyltransferase OCH1-like enzyme